MSVFKVIKMILSHFIQCVLVCALFSRFVPYAMKREQRWVVSRRGVL